MSQSTPSSTSGPSPDSASGARGAAVVTDDGSYPMFELRELRGDGALLSGPLLLEVSEELTLRLQPAGGAPLVLRARVTGVETAGLAVSFVDLSPAERQRLQALRP